MNTSLSFLKRGLLALTVIFSNEAHAQSFLWTWFNGAKSVNGVGAYGTMGVPSPTNLPPARRFGGSWTGADGRFWLFGGVDTDFNTKRNDLWVYDPATEMWTWMKGSSLTNQAGVFGTQGVPADANTPSSRSPAVTWTDANGKLWLFGGSSSAGLMNDLWRYDPATNQWTWIKGSSAASQNGTYGTLGTPAASNTPGGRDSAVGWVDPQGRLWLFGGTGYGATSGTDNYLNDVWMYNLSTNQWTWRKGSNATNASGVYGTQGTPATTNTPGARVRPALWRDAKGDVWLFGGRNGTGDFHDTWRFEPATTNWTWMKGTNLQKQASIFGTQNVPDAANLPASRAHALSWLDSQGRFWLYGGLGQSGTSSSVALYDLWRYEPLTNNWVWVRDGVNSTQFAVYGTLGSSTATTRPGAKYYSHSWIDPRGRLCVFGGEGYSDVTAGLQNDFWRFEPEPVPHALTQPATQVLDRSATLEARVNPNNGATLVKFRRGLSPTLSDGTDTATINLDAGIVSQTASMPLTGLTPSTTYYYQVVTSNAVGTGTGAIVPFTTSANLPPTGGTMTSSIVSPTLASSAITVTFANWADTDAPTTYEVLLNGTVVSARGATLVRSITGPAANGNHTLTGRIYDSLNAFTTVNIPFTVDALAPTLPIVTIASNNASPAWAKSGNTITLSFTANEAIQIPAVIIAGRAAVVTGNGTTWQATTLIDDASTEGTAAFSITYTDITGNPGAVRTTTSNSSAVIIDLGAPVLTLNGPAAVTIEAASVYAEQGATAQDAIAGNVTAAIQQTGSVNTVIPGTYPLTYTVSDPAGNVASTMRQVQVQDTTAPTLAGPFTPLTIVTGATGTVPLPNYVPQAVALDAVGVTSIVQNPAAGTLQSAGTTGVTLTASDASGNTTNVNFLVLVSDGTNPEIAAPAGDFAPLTISTGANGFALAPDYTSQAITSDNVAVSAVTQSPLPAASLSAGPMTITLTAHDPSGNTRTLSFAINVLDGTKPAVSAPPAGLTPASLVTGPGGTVALPDYTPQAITSDNVSVTAVVQNPPAGSPRSAGTTTVTLTASDAAGNMESIAADIAVLDGTKPAIAPPVQNFTPLALTTGADATAPLPNYATQAITSDNVGVTDVSQSPPAGSPRTSGITTVTLTAIDAVGNSEAISFQVTVNDGTMPTIAPPESGFTPLAVTTGPLGTVPLPDYTPQSVTADNVGITSVTQTPLPNSALPFGQTTVILTARDAAGNEATTSFVVEIHDGTAPAISAPPGGFTPPTITADAAGLAILPDYTAQAITSDNVAVVSVTQNPEIGSSHPEGQINVTLTAHDNAGNMTSTSFPVRVRLSLRLLHELATTGGTVPGAGIDSRIPAGAVFTDLGIPALDDAGLVAFLGYWKAGRATGVGIFSGNPLTLMVAAGDEAIGIPGSTLKSLQDPLVSPGGGIIFGATAQGGTVKPTNDKGVWFRAPQSPALLMLREGSQVPGMALGNNVNSVTSLSVQDDGILATITLKPGVGNITKRNDNILLRLGTTGASAALREASMLDLGDGAPAAAVAKIESLIPVSGSPAHGRWHASNAALARITLADKRTALIRMAADGTLEDLLTQNASVPEISPTAYWAGIELPAIAADGVTSVVRGRLKSVAIPGVPPDVARHNDSAIAFDDGGGFSIFAREGMPAPDSGGALFGEFADPIINDRAHTAVVAKLTGAGVTTANNSGLWSGTPTALRLIARRGSSAPDAFGTATGALWADISSLVLPDGDESGPIFLATVRGGGVTAKNRVGLWAVDSTGLVRQILRTGDVFADSTITGITALCNVPGSLGASRGFNSHRKVAIRLALRGGRQCIVVADIP